MCKATEAMEVDFAGKRKMESDSDDTSKPMKSKRAEVMGHFNCLYIHTPDFLLQLDLKNSSNSVPFSTTDKFPPSPTVALRYDGFSYPVGMGVIPFKSDIYFVGGEYLHVADEDDEYDGYSDTVYRSHDSNKVFKFIPGDNRLEESHMSMNSAKSLPTVKLIQDKIYVLQTYPLHGPLECWPATHTTFEVLDVSNALPIWKKLKSPPFYDGDFGAHSLVTASFAFHNKFYVLTMSGQLHYFDTCNESWHEEKNFSKVSAICSKSPPTIPLGGRMLSEDVILAFWCDRDHLYEYLGPRLRFTGYLYSKDGCLLAYQIFDCLDLFPLELYGYSWFLMSMEDGKFCALTVGYSTEHLIPCDAHMVPILVLAVSIFTVRKLTRADEIQASTSAPAPAASDNFLSMQVEKQYIFLADEEYDMRGAFFA